MAAHSRKMHAQWGTVDKAVQSTWPICRGTDKDQEGFKNITLFTLNDPTKQRTDATAIL